MSISATRLVWAQDGITPSTRYVLLAIADMINRSGEAWPGQKQIAAKCRISERMVRKHLVLATKAGAINVVQTPGKNSVYSFPTPEPDDLCPTRHPGTRVPHPPEPEFRTPPYLNRKRIVEDIRTGEEKIESPKLIPDTFPAWFETLQGVEVKTSDTPVSASDFSKLRKWAEGKGYSEEILERSANYVDSAWNSGLKRRNKVYSTFQNAAMKEASWNDGTAKTGTDRRHTSANSSGRSGAFADADRYSD